MLIRAVGFILAMVGIAFMLLSFVSGSGGGFNCLVSIALMIVGALLFASAQRADKKADDERKHEEMLEAIRQSKSKE